MLGHPLAPPLLWEAAALQTLQRVLVLRALLVLVPGALAPAWTKQQQQQQEEVWNKRSLLLRSWTLCCQPRGSAAAAPALMQQQQQHQ